MIADGVDVVEVSRTCWIRPLRYEENQVTTVPSRPYECRGLHCKKLLIDQAGSGQ